MIKISIVTVVLNAVNTIERCLSSVTNQTFENIESVVIDGGSTDGTLRGIKRYRDRIAYFVSEADRGLYHAMNKGIQASTGDYVYFLNSDDYFCDNDVLADVVATISDDPSLDLVYGDVLMQTGEHTVRKAQVPVLNRESLCRRGLCHQALFARRDILIRTGGFSEDYPIVADGDWLARTLASGAKSLHIPRDIATISLEGLSSTSNWREEKRRSLRANYTPWELFRWRKLPGILGRKKD
ncbi:MAG: glycosyltransferase family 2 protein [Gammaproteobacteria bacterium]